MELKEHLAECLACRRELSRLRLLWLELAQPEKVPLPHELPHLRQQVLAAASPAHGEPGKEKSSFWNIQKLAWYPLCLTTAYLPGVGGARELVRTAGRELPGLLRGSLAVTRSLLRLGRLTRKGRGAR